MKFGPSGNSDSFIIEGHASTVEAPQWIKAKGLDIFEYSFGRGVRIGEEHSRAIGAEAAKHGIEISVHSPYYVNLASDNDETVINSMGYIMKSIEALQNFGGNRCVVHPGSPLKQSREEAVERMLANFESLAEMIIESNLSDIIICPETMGKNNQMGTLDEVLKICRISEIFIPCVDFGHINSRSQGSLMSPDGYRQIFDRIYQEIGEDRGSRVHIHFSRIEYGKSGEIRHLTFEDEIFGPFFEHLAPVLHEYKVKGRVLSESAGMQAEEAVIMKNLYDNYKSKQADISLQKESPCDKI